MPVHRALVLSVVLLGLTQFAAGGAPSPNTLTEHEDRQFSKVKDYLKENNIHVHGNIPSICPNILLAVGLISFYLRLLSPDSPLPAVDGGLLRAALIAQR